MHRSFINLRYNIVKDTVKWLGIVTSLCVHFLRSVIL